MDTKDLVLRRLTSEDVPVCSQIVYDAFKVFGESVGQTEPEFASPEATAALLNDALTDPEGSYTVVAVVGGQILGINFIHCADDVATIGPIAVDPKNQAKGLGRVLMKDVIDEGIRRGKRIRLTQVASNLVSASLYLSLGFAMVESLIAFSGKYTGPELPYNDIVVSKMAMEDVPAGDALHKSITGVSRLYILSYGVESGGYPEENTCPPLVAKSKSGEIVGWINGFFLDACAVAKNEDVAKALIVNASKHDNSRTCIIKFHLIPIRNPDMVRWALQNGFRMNQQANVMALDAYVPPTNGLYLPGVSY